MYYDFGKGEWFLGSLEYEVIVIGIIGFVLFDFVLMFIF